jgi:D-lactate dehydrogenase
MEAIAKLLEDCLPSSRIKTRMIDLVAYSADAGFYTLLPKAVVLPDSLQEIIKLFSFSQQYKIPLVFRAAGTSLSGQSITDGILVDLSQHWAKVNVESNGEQVRMQPGVIAAHANALLKKYKRKIGPDPASISSAMIGGIISNNSSGMCCGVRKNAYHTTRYIRFVLPNGMMFSTECEEDYDRFKVLCPHIYYKIALLRDQVKNNRATFDLVRRKYLTKNTVGYSMNAFLDFEDPLDILAHLMIGAEGTLGFIAEAVMETVPDHAFKYTALLFFPDVSAACQSILPLSLSGAEAIELMDRASLKAVEDIAGVPSLIRSLPEKAAALLVEYQGDDLIGVRVKHQRFEELAMNLSLRHPDVFTSDPVEQALLWKVRKGMFPSVGAVRARGTTVILEDVAFPIESLADAIADLQVLFLKHAYFNAIIFGHAKDGNIHFVITQAFETAGEIKRYGDFINEVVDLVVHKYQGTLKAEHGTGRNMAPFVETEWGEEIYQLMKELKQVVDPLNLLNPGVIINADPHVHLKNLKTLPQVEEEVDRCMECGFCESTCPSRNITLTPRKRIVVRRELLKLKQSGQGKQYTRLLKEYRYDGLATCAVDGLCAIACPVDINTGDLIKRLRRESHSNAANYLALLSARNFKQVTRLVRSALGLGIHINGLMGPETMIKFTGLVRKIIPTFPLWSNGLALAAPVPTSHNGPYPSLSVVYFPTCISRVMGEPGNKKSLIQTFFDVSAKAGIQLIVPDQLEQQCCGQIYASKGFKKALNYTLNKTIEKLWNTTNQGEIPVVVDISSCTQTLLNCRPILSAVNQPRYDKIKIIDSIDYMHDYIMPRITIAVRKSRVTIHPVCSLQKMPGTAAKLSAIAAHCADMVISPLHAGCCGMAGDRGFLYPELTRSATLAEAVEVKSNPCEGYYSSSKTCEIALSDATGQAYESILYLLDACSN